MPLCNQDFCSQPSRSTCPHVCPDYCISYLTECANPLDRQPWSYGVWGQWYREEIGCPSHETDLVTGTMWKAAENFIVGRPYLPQGHSCFLGPIHCVPFFCKSGAQGSLSGVPLSLRCSAQVRDLTVRLQRCKSHLQYFFTLWPWEN